MVTEEDLKIIIISSRKLQIFCVFMIFFLTTINLYIFSDKSLPGELNIAHGHLQDQDKCFSCHNPEYKIDFRKCLVCHKGIQKRIKSSRGYHRDKYEDCSDCHQEHRGKNSKLVDFETREFDHKETGYILKGAHRRVGNCPVCHSGSNSIKKKFTFSYFLRSSKCSACHKDVHNNMYPDCEECHKTDDWSVDIWIP